MANIKKGILGGVSGKIGNVVGGNWKGIDYLRTLPSSYNDAKSTTQVSNRTKMAVCMRFIKQFKVFLRIGFKAMAVKKTAFNAAFAYNYHRVIQGDYPNFTIDYPAVTLSLGSLTGVFSVSLESTTAKTVNSTWDNNSNEGSAKADDLVMIVFYQEELNEVSIFKNAASREEDNCTLTVPSHFSGKDVHCWITTRRPEGDVTPGESAEDCISKSFYAGTVSVM